AVNVTAQFDPQQFLLTLVASGPGDGTVTLDGAIFCTLSRGQGAATCTGLVDAGRTVQLVATPSIDSKLTGLGGDCGGSNPCSLQITKDVQVTAVFDNAASSLSVSLLGPGEGSVFTSWGINCTRVKGVNSGTCAAAVSYGTTVVLTASPLTPSWFVQWGGACKGELGPNCTITVTRSLTISADFEQVR
ncbi:MAG: hypothetical protein ABI877_15070, partial [Gemmatimonadaceae bacterium]